MRERPSRRTFVTLSSIGAGLAASSSGGSPEGANDRAIRIPYAPALGHRISGPETNKRILFDIWGQHTQMPALAQMSDGSLIAAFGSLSYAFDEKLGKFGEATGEKRWVTRSTDGGHGWQPPVEMPYETEPRWDTIPWDVFGGDEYLGVARFSCQKENLKLSDGSTSEAAAKLIGIKYVNGQFQFRGPIAIAPIGSFSAGPPAITRTVDGELAVVYSVGPRSAKGRLYVALKKSKDHGYTWGEEIIVDPIECGTSAGKSYHVLVQLPDGALTTFWTEVRPQIFMRKSYDGGKTWTQRVPVTPFRDPRTGRQYSYQKLIHAVTLGEWGSNWYTDIVCAGRALDRLLNQVPGGLVTSHSYDGGYTWEETQILDQNLQPPRGTPFGELLRKSVREQNLGYGSIVRTPDKVLVASSGIDIENLRQKCFLYEVPGLVTPALKTSSA